MEEKQFVASEIVVLTDNRIIVKQRHLFNMTLLVRYIHCKYDNIFAANATFFTIYKKFFFIRCIHNSRCCSMNASKFSKLIIHS